VNIPPTDEGHNLWALVAAGVLTAVGTVYKLFFRVRQDVRDDRKSGTIHGTYEEVIESLREQLREERIQRQKAEDRVTILEKRLRDAGHYVEAIQDSKEQY
jgi:hypothetical protein